MERSKKRLTFKKYVARRTYRKIGKVGGLSTHDLAVKCEYYDTLYAPVGAPNKYQIGTTSANYLNISACLTGSPSFTDNTLIYSRYKITGISVKVVRIAEPDPINCPILPVCNIAFYPHLLSYDAGVNPSFNDAKLSANVFDQTKPSYKYWKIKDNFFEGVNGGYGTWNDIGQYVNITGQLSIDNQTDLENVGGTDPAELLVTVYVVFGTRTK